MPIATAHRSSRTTSTSSAACASAGSARRYWTSSAGCALGRSKRPTPALRSLGLGYRAAAAALAALSRRLTLPSLLPSPLPARRPPGVPLPGPGLLPPGPGRRAAAGGEPVGRGGGGGGGDTHEGRHEDAPLCAPTRAARPRHRHPGAAAPAPCHVLAPLLPREDPLQHRPGCTRAARPWAGAAGRAAAPPAVPLTQPLPLSPRPPRPPGRPFLLPQVVHSDADAVAVCKPAGVPVHVSGQYRKNTVAGVLQALRPDLAPLLPVHRLDKPVSGLLLFARTPAAANRLAQAIQVRRAGAGAGGGAPLVCALPRTSSSAWSPAGTLSGAAADCYAARVNRTACVPPPPPAGPPR